MKQVVVEHLNLLQKTSFRFVDKEHMILVFDQYRAKTQYIHSLINHRHWKWHAIKKILITPTTTNKKLHFFFVQNDIKNWNFLMFFIYISVSTMVDYIPKKKGFNMTMIILWTLFLTHSKCVHANASIIKMHFLLPHIYALIFAPLGKSLT